MAWRLAGRRLALNYEKIDDALTAAGGPLPIRLIPILLKTQQLGNQHERADEEIATLELLLARLRKPSGMAAFRIEPMYQRLMKVDTRMKLRTP